MEVSQLTEALDAFVPEILGLCRAPGMSIALGTGDQVAWAKGYGYADLGAGRPMDTATVGPTGSDAKPYTAVAVMQLVERGLIGLDDPIREYLGDLRVANPLGEREITLRDLLTHRSGLGTDLGFCDGVPPAPLGELLRRVFAAGRTDAYRGGVFVPAVYSALSRSWRSPQDVLTRCFGALVHAAWPRVSRTRAGPSSSAPAVR